LGTGQYAEAEPLLKRALDFQIRHNGYDNEDTLNTSDSLAELYIEQARYAEARPFLVKGLDSYRRVFGPEHPFTQRELYGLGKVLLGEGNYGEAEERFAEALAVEQRVKGPRHPDTFNTASQLAQAYVEEGKFAQAISLLENTVRDSREALGPGARDTLTDEVGLGWAYDAKGDLPHAEQIWRSTLQGFRALGKDQEADAVDVSELLGQNLNKQRKFLEAEPLLRQALAFREKENRNDWRIFRTQAFLGAALAGLGKYAEAEPLLLSGYQGMSASRMPAKQKKWIRSSGEQIVELYSQWSKPEQAAQWRAKLQGS
jgi:tetratricopeptide (TPR) repeat protein